MSDIQRWAAFPNGCVPMPDDEGTLVTYADHVAAVAAAREELLASGWKRLGPAYEAGQRDELIKAREAVVAYHKGSCRRYYAENRCTCGLDAAIDGVKP